VATLFFLCTINLPQLRFMNFTHICQVFWGSVRLLPWGLSNCSWANELRGWWTFVCRPHRGAAALSRASRINEKIFLIIALIYIAVWKGLADPLSRLPWHGSHSTTAFCRQWFRVQSARKKNGLDITTISSFPVRSVHRYHKIPRNWNNFNTTNRYSKRSKIRVSKILLCICQSKDLIYNYDLKYNDYVCLKGLSI